MKEQLDGLIGQYYASRILNMGGSPDIPIKAFVTMAADQTFLAYARGRYAIMRQLAGRDYVAKVGAEFLDRAFAAMG